MREKVASPDLVVSRIAARQHGVISTRQLLGLGIRKDGVSRRVGVGRLHRVHQGVYAVGNPSISPEGRWAAAVLACGGGSPADVHRGGERDRSGGDPAGSGDESFSVLDYWGAAISHRSAAVLWGLLPNGPGAIDVSVSGDGGRARRHGICLHRSLSLLPADVTLHRGIPVTKSARTIADLQRDLGRRQGQGIVTAKELHRAIRQADALGLPTGLEHARDRSRSKLERRFLRLCRQHGLPVPENNVWVGGHEVDFLWRKARLTVETDGYRFHRGRTAFEDDRARDLDLRGLGFEVLRLTERQIVDDPDRVADTLRGALTPARLRVGADGDEREI